MRELALVADARSKNAEAENRRWLAMTWNLAALMRCETLPPLGELLEPRPKETPEEELSRLAREHQEIVAAMERAKPQPPEESKDG